MRQLAWLLLLANLGMFAWLLTQPEPQAPGYRPVPVPPGIEPLVLLSERSADTDTVAGQSTKMKAKTATEPAPPVDQQVASNEGVVDEMPDDAGVQQESVEPDTPSPAAPAVSAPEPRCRTVGPFMTQSDAEAVSRQLEALDYQPGVRTGEVQIPAGYWVYMPSMRAAEARRIVAELEARGITDYYIGKQNYISLGIFSGKRKAQMRLEQIEALGYDAILDLRSRNTTVYWIDIREGDTPLSDSEAWSDIQANHAGIRVERIACE